MTSEPFLILTDIEDITLNLSTQPRAGVDLGAIEDYARAMLSGSKFPPIDVFLDPNGDVYLAAGWHRLQAAKTAGFKQIEARVHAGTLREAVLFSFESNHSNGLRLTQAEKRATVDRMLTDEEWSKWADREIARICGVSHQMVGMRRAKIGADVTERQHMQGGKVVTSTTYANRKRPKELDLELPRPPREVPLDIQIGTPAVNVVALDIHTKDGALPKGANPITATPAPPMTDLERDVLKILDAVAVLSRTPVSASQFWSEIGQIGEADAVYPKIIGAKLALDTVFNAYPNAPKKRVRA